ncbi:hypothetical protein, partial [Paraburkholderia sp. RL17-373-BIF-A]|uniref:hypothetical protein n=1 Tax=Paraburkholderia sp. RL17-373-BIF-A TaxID=3031629 RepID=UPI0038B76677
RLVFRTKPRNATCIATGQVAPDGIVNNTRPTGMDAIARITLTRAIRRWQNSCQAHPALAGA